MRNNGLSNGRKSKEISRKTALFGILAALAIALSFFESLMPPLFFLPVGAKLGLSNIVTMTAACVLGIPYALSIAVVKALFALFTRGFVAMLLSFAGGFLSALTVSVLLKFKRAALGYTAISALGAVVHNLSQLLVCILMTSNRLLIYYAPALILFGVAAGVINGAVMILFDKKGFKKLI